MNGLTDEADPRLRFDVLTKTRQPELHRYGITRDRAANVRLYRLAAEVLAAALVIRNSPYIEAARAIGLGDGRIVSRHVDPTVQF